MWGGESSPQQPFKAAGPAGKRVRGQNCPPHALRTSSAICLTHYTSRGPLQGCRPEAPLLVLLHAREPDVALMPKAADPSFVGGARQPAGLLVDGLDRIEIERRHP